MQRRVEAVLGDDVAGESVEEQQRRRHRREIELCLAGVRMGLDAADADRDRATVGEEDHLVWPDPQANAPMRA